MFREISLGQKEAFNRLFYDFYERLVQFAVQYTKQPEPAEEVVSTVFVNIWQKRERLAAVKAPEVYLFVAVKNGCLNFLRRSSKTIRTGPDTAELPEGCRSDGAEYKELEVMISNAIDRLPVQRQLIFRLIREEGLKAKEVAAILSVSVRTVESQLYKAVKSLAAALSDYLGYHPQRDGHLREKLFSLFF